MVENGGKWLKKVEKGWKKGGKRMEKVWHKLQMSDKKGTNGNGRPMAGNRTAKR